MHDPLTAGRRLASRAIVWQAGATTLVALAFLAQSAPSALAAGIGGGAVVAGAVVSALVALGGGVQPAGTAVARLLIGVALRWIVVLALLALGLAGLKLPPLPMLVGVTAATLAFVLVNLLKR